MTLRYGNAVHQDLRLSAGVKAGQPDRSQLAATAAGFDVWTTMSRPSPLT